MIIRCTENNYFRYTITINGRYYANVTWSSWKRLHHVCTYRGYTTRSGCIPDVRFVHYFNR